MKILSIFCSLLISCYTNIAFSKSDHVCSFFSGDVLPNCSENEFLGDDKKCYSCDEPKEIPIVCHMKYEEVKSICPNRYFNNYKSYLNCPQNTIIWKDLCIHNPCSENETYNYEEKKCCKGCEAGETIKSDFCCPPQTEVPYRLCYNRCYYLDRVHIDL